MRAAPDAFASPGVRMQRALRRYAARRRLRTGTTVVLIGAVAVAAWVLVAACVDRWAVLPDGVRWGVWVGTVAGATFVAVRATIAWRTGDDTLAAARRIESRDRGWGERLITVATQATLPPEQRGSAVMNAVLAAEVERDWKARPPVVRPPRRAALVFAAMLTLWAGLWTVTAFDLPRLVDRELRPWALLTPVTLTGLDLVDPPTSVRQGKPLAIVAVVGAGAPVPTAWVGADAARLHAVPMTAAAPHRYAATLPAAQRDFVYRVTAGDAVAGPVAVKVLRPPGLLTMTLRLDYPAATRRPPLTLTQSDGRLSLPAGTRVTVTLTATEALKHARIRVGESWLTGQEDVASGAWHTTFTVSKPAGWLIDLVAENGLHGAGPVGMRIDVVPG